MLPSNPVLETYLTEILPCLKTSLLCCAPENNDYLSESGRKEWLQYSHGAPNYWVVIMHNNLLKGALLIICSFLQNM